MVSYKKRCSGCGDLGHTIRECLKTTRRLLDTLAQEAQNKTTKCSFCKGENHHKDDCKERRAFINLLASDCLSSRQEILERMQRFGVGVGCLLSFLVMDYDTNTSEWTEQRRVGMVREVMWERITQLSRPGRRLDHSSALLVNWNDDQGEPQVQKIKLPEIITHFESTGEEEKYHDVVIVSPVKVDPKTAPQTFLEFAECVEVVRRLISHGYL